MWGNDFREDMVAYSEKLRARARGRERAFGCVRARAEEDREASRRLLQLLARLLGAIHGSMCLSLACLWSGYKGRCDL